jgi:ribonuclease P protein component
VGAFLILPFFLTTAPLHNGLSQAERLKSRKQTEALFAGGRSFFVHPIKVVYAIAPPTGGHLPTGANAAVPAIQVGVSASKRLFKRAVDRNRIKRLLREAYRQQKHGLQQQCQQQGCTLQVFFIYTHKQLPDYQLLAMKMADCLARLQKAVQSPAKP